MSNLGKYQDVVVEAARHGGVDKWIKIIEDNAVAKNFPRIFMKGAGVGACVAAVGAVVGKHFSDKSRARETRADEAREHLKAMAGERTDLYNVNPEHPVDEDDSDSGSPL